MFFMARAGKKVRPYHYLTALAIAGIVTLGLLPLMGGSAQADPGSCASAQATVAADQTALENLLDQLNTATSVQTQDKAAVDQLNNQINDDQNLIDKYTALETTTDNAATALEQAIGETIQSVGKDVRKMPFDYAQEITLIQIEAGLEREIKGIEETVRQIGADALQDATLLAQADQAQLASVLSKMASPVLKGLGYIGYALLANEAGTLLGDDIALNTDLNQLDSMDADYNKAKNEIGGLKAQLPDAQALLAADDSKVAGLDSQEAAAKAAWLQAIQAADAACQPTPTPTDMPTSTPTPTDSPTPTPTPTGTSTSTPPPGPPDHGTTYGDPHLVTFDGVHYDFQQVGEFILAKSTVDDFQIQVRQSPWAGTSQSVAENAAVAFEVAGHRVGIYATGSGVNTMVDSQSVTLPDSTAYPLPGGGTITNISATDQEVASWPNGSVVTVGYGGGFYLTLDVGVAEAEHGHLVGLLGPDDGNPAGDLVTRTGTVLPDPPTTAELYGEFSSSWRISQSESLFDYGAGQTTATFTDLNFPYAPATLSGLTTAEQQSATATCQALGVRTEPYLDDCVLDVATTGDPNAGLAEVTAQAYEATTPGNLVVNGGFELPSDGSSTYIEYAGGSTAIPGWTVGGNSVDVTSTSYWEADQGTQSLDLAGSAPGSVTQTVATTPGATYTLSWALAGNTNCGASVKTMDVGWNGTVVDAPTFDTTGHSNSSMGYVDEQVTVTATGPSSQITFADATAGDTLCGPVLDNVALIQQS